MLVHHLWDDSPIELLRNQDGCQFLDSVFPPATGLIDHLEIVEALSMQRISDMQYLGGGIMGRK